MDDVAVALEKADRHLAMIGTLYEADLELQRPSPTLRAKVNAFLEVERAALDHLAARVLAAGGAAEAAGPEYPLAPDEPRFEVALDKHLPGVREARPEVAAAIARHQPFTVPALAQLRALLLEPKRQRLTPEAKPAPEDVAPPPPPAAEPAPEPEPAAPAPRPPSGGLSGGLTGPLVINGVEHDPITLRPLQPLPEVRRETIYVAWRFDGDEATALRSLEAIQAAVAATIGDVSAAAGLA